MKDILCARSVALLQCARSFSAGGIRFVSVGSTDPTYVIADCDFLYKAQGFYHSEPDAEIPGWSSRSQHPKHLNKEEAYYHGQQI